MKLLSWTVRGLSDVKKKLLVWVTIQSSGSDIVVIQEAKKEELHFRIMRWILGFDLLE